MKPYVDAYFPPSTTPGTSGIICKQSTGKVHPLISDEQIITLAFAKNAPTGYGIYLLQNPDTFTPGDIAIDLRCQFFLGSFAKNFISFYTDADHPSYSRYTSQSSWRIIDEPSSIPFDFHLAVKIVDTPVSTDAFIYSIDNQ